MWKRLILSSFVIVLLGFLGPKQVHAEDRSDKSQEVQKQQFDTWQAIKRLEIPSNTNLRENFSS